MEKKLFSRFAPVIRSLTSFGGQAAPDSRLLLDQEGDLSIYYAPFDYINPAARVVIVGITPGRVQMDNALREAQRQLNAGAAPEVALHEAKKTGAFSGPMRNNLVDMLDYLGVHKWLDVPGCSSLFAAGSSLVQTTSVLRYPVFVRGENYNGTPSMLRHPLLKRYLETYFVEEVRALPDTVFIPLGGKVTEVFDWLVSENVIEPYRVLDGLQHPSGANAERIAYLLERKPRERLSVKTDPDKIDRARIQLREKMAELLRKKAG